MYVVLLKKGKSLFLQIDIFNPHSSYLNSSLDNGFPLVQLWFCSIVSSESLGTTGEVRVVLAPPLLGSDVHFGRRFLNNTTDPHVPIYWCVC
jgi:hypothetical protein